jgi:hypothetical protein
MESTPHPEWAMDVVLVCHVTPPSDVLRKAVDELCGSECEIGYDNERPVVKLLTEAGDSGEAVAALNAKAQQLVERLADRFDCSIESTTRLENRYVPLETYEAPSLGEGS